jgi:hypothetical protein
MIPINFESKKNYYFAILIVIIFGFALRVYGFNSNGYWADEWYTLFFSNPNNSYIEFKYNLGPNGSGLPTYENTPWLFYIFLKFIFIIFGYYAEIGRIFILIFAVGSIYLSLKIISKCTTNKQLIIFFLILVSSNPFLVIESQETRVQSVVLFFGLWNLIEFLKLIDQINFKNITTFVLSMVLVMSFSPVTTTLLFSYLIYISINFYKKKIKIISFLLIFLMSIFIYIVLNYEYLSNVFLAKQFQGISSKFFFSYFFSTFFGTYFLGGFVLLFLVLSTIINFKKIFLDKKILLIYIIVGTTYFFLIVKSIESNLLIARYVIFIVPLILILVIRNLENNIYIKKDLFKSFFIYMIIFLQLINTFYQINNRPIKKPPTNDLITYISRSQVKTVSSENFLFGNYLKTHYLFTKKDLKYLNYDKLNKHNSSFWLICTNNMRSIVSTKNLEDFRHVKCSSKIAESKMRVVEKFNIPDLQARLYVKK